MNKLIFIGLGLYSGKDISCKGLEALKQVDEIFAEFYTSKMAEDSIGFIESKINKKIHHLSRTQVEDGELILSKASEKAVAFLCQGDPFTATTHVDLLLRAKKRKIPIQVVHASSIVTAVPGLLGLQFYKFGRTTTLAYPEGDYFPESPFEVISENLQHGLHTLILLDIKSEDNRYMTANEGLELLLEINNKRSEKVITDSTIACIVARAGSDDRMVVADKIGKLLKLDFGEPLHTIVIPGKLHFRESEALITLADAPNDILNMND
jgi:diphthine synthase